MTENRLIALNVVATYGRSLIALFIGLFTSRWVLWTLGKEDYGLYGMVGGMIFFVSFLNFLFTNSISRFYAIGQGRLRKSEDNLEALERCCQWFSLSVTLMLVVPTLLVIIGYPIGIWAIRNWLNIPADRIESCVWVLRFAFLSMWVGFANVPFSAMYTAKQRIAELTIYSLFQSLFTFVFALYMINHPGLWLTKYALGMCLITVIPQLIICFRAFVVFPECHIRVHHLFEISKLKELVSFAGWSFFGNLGWVLKVHGIAILVNKYYGASANASLMISNQVTNHSNALSSALQGAFSPAIMTAYGAGEMDRFRSLVNIVCRLKAMLFAVFMLPLFVEMDEVLILWLRDPPPSSVVLCCTALISMLFDNCTSGCYIAICANGDISRYQIVSGMLLVVSLPLAWIAAGMGWGIASVAVALLVSQVGASFSSVYFASRLMNFSILRWFCDVFIPIIMICFMSSTVAYILRIFIHQGILRLIMSSLVLEGSLLPLFWFAVMKKEEREYLLGKYKFLMKFVRT